MIHTNIEDTKDAPVDKVGYLVRVNLSKYASHGQPPGGFLTAVLSNNLYQAVQRADLDNLANMEAIVNHIQNTLPYESYGSPEKVKAWYEKFSSI